MKGTDNRQISHFNALLPPSYPNPIFTLLFGLLHISQLEHSRVAGPCQALPQSKTLLEIVLYFNCGVTTSQKVTLCTFQPYLKSPAVIFLDCHLHKARDIHEGEYAIC